MKKTSMLSPARFSNLFAVMVAAIVLAGCASSVSLPPPQQQAAPEPVAAPQPAPVAPAVQPAPQPQPAQKEEPKPPVVLTAPVGAKQVEPATVFFDFDKSDLKAEATATLDALAAKAQGKKVEVMIVVGHTDSVGTPEYNQKLSVRRAESVKSYLISKGIDKDCIYSEGKGKEAPARSNESVEGRAKNRRAEVELVIVP